MLPWYLPLSAAPVLLLSVSLLAAALWGWWCLRTARYWAREEAAANASSLLASSAESLLEHHDTAELRRFVADAAGRFGFSRVTIRLPSGEIVADSEPLAITLPRLPEEWAGEFAQDVTGGPGLVSATVLNVPGRGQARLEVSHADPSTGPTAAGFPGANASDVETSELLPFALIGALAVAGMVALQRRIGRRHRVAEAVRLALRALQAGETESAALQVGPVLGEEADAWNELLAHRDERLAGQRDAELRAALGSRDAASGITAACDLLPHGLLTVDDAMRIRFANGAAAAMFRRPKEAVGVALQEVVDASEVLDTVRQILDGRRRRAVLDVERNEAQGRSCLRFSIRPLRRDDGGGAVISVEDVTQLKIAEAARNSFVAQATHELRAPLTNIRLHVESVIEDADQDAAARAESLNVISAESRRLERIVAEMLSVSEIEAGSFSLRYADVRLEALFQETQADFMTQARDKQLELCFDLPPKLPVISADRDKFVLALQNLLSNALKYTPAGGRVDVIVQATERQLSVAVRDTGLGISEQDQARLFQRFFRADEVRQRGIVGTGLGLALAREVIRLHGGDIAVESQVGKGSTFTILLPIRAEAAAA